MKTRMIAIIGALTCVCACAKKEEAADNDFQEPAQQIGDVMASVDEAGGSSGALAQFKMQQSYQKFFARNVGKEQENPLQLISRMILPKAEAHFCSSAQLFSSCSNNVITRTFDDCSVAFTGISIEGNVQLTWDDAAVDNVCLMTLPGHSVTRVPDFTIKGRRGASLQVSKVGSVGQKLTYNGGTDFTFTNDGIRRVFNGHLGANFDFTTETTGPGLSVSGTIRNGRVLSSTGGSALRVTNNNTGASCDYVPENVTWNGSCNCPVSGKWTATCSDGRSPSLEILGCGTGHFDNGELSKDVEFDRCYGL